MQLQFIVNARAFHSFMPIVLVRPSSSG